jgi:hypothetical protein
MAITPNRKATAMATKSTTTTYTNAAIINDILLANFDSGTAKYIVQARAALAAQANANAANMAYLNKVAKHLQALGAAAHALNMCVLANPNATK